MLDRGRIIVSGLFRLIGLFDLMACCVDGSGREIGEPTVFVLLLFSFDGDSLAQGTSEPEVFYEKRCLA